MEYLVMKTAVGYAKIGIIWGVLKMGGSPKPWVSILK
jgi:hypothetical protein